jgi:hypothetical protein
MMNYECANLKGINFFAACACPACRTGRLLAKAGTQQRKFEMHPVGKVVFQFNPYLCNLVLRN